MIKLKIQIIISGNIDNKKYETQHNDSKKVAPIEIFGICSNLVIPHGTEGS